MARKKKRTKKKLPSGMGGNRQGPRASTLGVTIKPGIRDLLEVASKDQFRSLSGQAAYYITEGLKADGYITPSESQESA